MKSRCIRVLSWALVAALMSCHTGIAAAQETPPPATSAPVSDAPQAAPPVSPVLRLTLEDALARARKNSTQFQSAQTDAALARQDRYQAAAALLPSVTYNNEALYTQLNPNGAVTFIANNAAHEYVSQANVHESTDLLAISNF